MSLGSTDGPQLLKKLGLVEHAIDYAIDSSAFPHAFDIARLCAQHKLSEIHLKYAMYLEDEGHFKEAEEEFIHAGDMSIDFCQPITLATIQSSSVQIPVPCLIYYLQT